MPARRLTLVSFAVTAAVSVLAIAGPIRHHHTTTHNNNNHNDNHNVTPHFPTPSHPTVRSRSPGDETFGAELKRLPAYEAMILAISESRSVFARTHDPSTAAGLGELRDLDSARHLLPAADADRLAHLRAGVEWHLLRAAYAGGDAEVLADARHLPYDLQPAGGKVKELKDRAARAVELAAAVKAGAAGREQAVNLADGELKADLITARGVFELKALFAADGAADGADLPGALEGVAPKAGADAGKLAVKLSAAAMATGHATAALKMLPADAPPAVAREVLRDLKAVLTRPADGAVPSDAKGPGGVGPREPPAGIAALLPEATRGATAAVRESVLADLPALQAPELDRVQADLNGRIGPAVAERVRASAAERDVAVKAARDRFAPADEYVRAYVTAVAARLHPHGLSARGRVEAAGAAVAGVPVDEFVPTPELYAAPTDRLTPLAATAGGWVFAAPYVPRPEFAPRERLRAAVRKAVAAEGARPAEVAAAVGTAKADGPTAADAALALVDVMEELSLARPEVYDSQSEVEEALGLTGGNRANTTAGRERADRSIAAAAATLLHLKADLPVGSGWAARATAAVTSTGDSPAGQQARRDLNSALEGRR